MAAALAAAAGACAEPSCSSAFHTLPSTLCVRAEVIKSCRFLGRAEVALSDTLTMLSGVPAGTPLWFPLMRRSASDSVRCAAAGLASPA